MGQLSERPRTILYLKISTRRAFTRDHEKVNHDQRSRQRVPAFRLAGTAQWEHSPWRRLRLLLRQASICAPSEDPTDVHFQPWKVEVVDRPTDFLPPAGWTRARGAAGPRMAAESAGGQTTEGRDAAVAVGSCPGGSVSVLFVHDPSVQPASSPFFCRRLHRPPSSPRLCKALESRSSGPEWPSVRRPDPRQVRARAIPVQGRDPNRRQNKRPSTSDLLRWPRSGSSR